MKTFEISKLENYKSDQRVNTERKSTHLLWERCPNKCFGHLNLTQICTTWTPLIYQNMKVSLNGQIGDATKNHQKSHEIKRISTFTSSKTNLENAKGGLPFCQEYQELPGIWEILPKSQEYVIIFSNVRKMSGAFYGVLSGDNAYFMFFCSMQKKVECKIKNQKILLSSHILLSAKCGIDVIIYIYIYIYIYMLLYIYIIYILYILYIYIISFVHCWISTIFVCPGQIFSTHYVYLLCLLWHMVGQKSDINNSLIEFLFMGNQYLIKNSLTVLSILFGMNSEFIWHFVRSSLSSSIKHFVLTKYTDQGSI